MGKLLREAATVLGVASIVAVFFTVFAITFTTEPPVGRRMVVKKRLAEAQENPYTGLAPGTMVVDPATHKMYRVQSSSTGPSDFVICPGGVPVTHNPTALDLTEAIRCRDGHPFRPEDRAAEGIYTPCTAGTVVQLCGRPGTPQAGKKVEDLGPSDEDYHRADELGKKLHGYVMPPEHIFTEPHSWLHLGIPEASAVVGEIGAFGTVGGVYQWTVVNVRYTSHGLYTVTIYYSGPNGDYGYSTLYAS